MFSPELQNLIDASLTDSELSQFIAQRRVNKETLAWVPGMTVWHHIEQVPAILKVIALTPPPLSI